MPPFFLFNRWAIIFSFVCKCSLRNVTGALHRHVDLVSCILLKSICWDFAIGGHISASKYNYISSFLSCISMIAYYNSIIFSIIVYSICLTVWLGFQVLCWIKNAQSWNSCFAYMILGESSVSPLSMMLDFSACTDVCNTVGRGVSVGTLLYADVRSQLAPWVLRQGLSQDLGLTE